MDEGIMICNDCASWHANADLSGVDDETRIAEVKAFPDSLAVDCGENEEYCDTFSKYPCEACGTRLAGHRHRAFLLDEKGYK